MRWELLAKLRGEAGFPLCSRPGHPWGRLSPFLLSQNQSQSQNLGIISSAEPPECVAVSTIVIIAGRIHNACFALQLMNTADSFTSPIQLQLQIHPSPTLAGHLAIGLWSRLPAQLYGLNFATATTAQCEMRNAKNPQQPTPLSGDRQDWGHVQKTKVSV